MFRDPESGIDFFMWSIGSQPGHSDIMEFTRESSECGINNKNQRLDIKEGHAYYITVKVKVSIHLIYCKKQNKRMDDDKTTTFDDSLWTYVSYTQRKIQTFYAKIMFSNMIDKKEWTTLTHCIIISFYLFDLIRS